MLKKVLNLKGAQGLSKNEQKEINGGLVPVSSKSCASVCINAPSGVRCRVHAACPLLDGVCNGQGGYIPL